MNLTVTHRYAIPGRFHAGHSLCGRWMRSREPDERRAEASFLLLLIAVPVVLVLAQYVGWAFVRQSVTEDPGGPVALAFWGVQLAAVALYVLGCVVGFQPAVEVLATAGGVRIRRGKETLTLAADEVLRTETVPALLFHRHHRRYAGTRVFINRMPPEVLLLHTEAGPVALGLTAADRDALIADLRARRSVTFEVADTRVA